MAFLLLAFAQPKWGQGMLSLGREGRDILILLDTSESMNAPNPAPTRLAKARQKIESLLERLPGDRVGLIPFSGGSTLSCPLTVDHAHFKNALMGVDTNTIDEEGTNISSAMGTAKDTFSEDALKNPENGKQSRAVILISDGEQIAGDAVTTAKELAKTSAVYVLGIGDPNGALVDYPQFNLQYGVGPSQRQPHLSKLDEATLAKVATEGEGMYVRATADDSDVDRLTEALESLTSRAVSGELRFNLVNRYQWPLALSILCFALEGLWLVLMPTARIWWLRRRRAREESAYV
nr:BatA [uncultured bacterium]